jgi:hypothetical protein
VLAEEREGILEVAHHFHRLVSVAELLGNDAARGVTVGRYLDRLAVVRPGPIAELLDRFSVDTALYERIEVSSNEPGSLFRDRCARGNISGGMMSTT